jgi:menaquinone-specific isochorismate synthase
VKRTSIGASLPARNLTDVIATTARLDDDLDPIAVGRHTGLLWWRAGLGLAGLGVAHRIPLSRPGGAAAAASTLADLVGPDEVGVPGTGPLAFAALPFDRSAPGELLVPEVVLGRGPEGRRWVTVLADGPVGSAGVADALRRLRAVPTTAGVERPEPTRFEIVNRVPPHEWTATVAAVRDRIAAGELTKAVLAREVVVTTDQPLEASEILDRLRRTFPTSILFAVDGFIGASPELLVGRIGDVVRAHPLAGTAARSSDPAADAALAAQLLASDKDRWEHRITIDWLLDTLLPFCSYVDAEPQPAIVSLANVHHLGTLVEGRLSSPPASVLELVEALHPTPAVGGEPQEAALAVIAASEGSDRGRYAGPVGWVDGAGNGQFAVGIRSAQLDGTRARLFAGVGVVADSDPQAELAETRAKLAALLGALLRP